MNPIFVTKPSLPPLEEYVDLLRDIWETRWLTNKGRYHDELETELAQYLGVPYVSLFCNGTIALQVGLQALRITGEVITTPFSFPATAHALSWNHCTPVFCDVDSRTGNLDPSKVESLITPKTTAILPVHIYGTPCDVIGLQRIAAKFGLRLFYDAAHTFGVKLHGTSILNYGDLEENGSIYVFRPRVLTEQKCRLGGAISVYRMAVLDSLQIDEPEDIPVVEFLLRRRHPEQVGDHDER